MHPAGAVAAALAWTALPPANLERTEVTAARIGDAIYVAGGGPQMGGGVKSAINEAFSLA